jgi:hypothetical protein
MGLKLFSNPFLLNSFRNGARSQVINFTTAFTESDALLLEEIRRQRQYNSRFCDKLFFAVNKIDQDNGNGQTLQDSISSIHSTLNNDYGFDLPRERVIGVAALPALLYRMSQNDLLTKKELRQTFNVEVQGG